MNEATVVNVLAFVVALAMVVFAACLVILAIKFFWRLLNPPKKVEDMTREERQTAKEKALTRALEAWIKN
jgi:hypothetical protein